MPYICTPSLILALCCQWNTISLTLLITWTSGLTNSWVIGELRCHDSNVTSLKLHFVYINVFTYVIKKMSDFPWDSPVSINVNSLDPGKFEWNFRYVILEWILVIDGWAISCDFALLWMSLDFNWWSVNIGLCNGLVTSDLCRHMALIGHNELNLFTQFHVYSIFDNESSLTIIDICKPLLIYIVCNVTFWNIWLSSNCGLVISYDTNLGQIWLR